MSGDLRLADRTLDLSTGQFSPHSAPLGAKQLALLRLLLAASPDPLSRAAATKAIWPEGLATTSRALDVMIGQLKKKLGPEATLKTVRGTGWMWVGELAPDPASGLPLAIGRAALTGRDTELAQLLAFCRDNGPAWLTVTGMGGIGKTRLAAEAARRLREEQRDVVWVDLAAQHNVASGLVAVARGLSPAYDGVTDAEAVIRRNSYDRKALLFVDNMEHLPELAPRIHALVRHSPVRVVATSRQLLDVGSALSTRLEGLDVEHHSSDLFVSLALASAPMAAASLVPGAVRDLCMLLEGHPLSLELAAAALRLRPFHVVSEALTKQVSELATTELGREERHKSLRATFAYSYDMLTQPQQGALAALSLFAGRFTRDDASTMLGLPTHDVVALWKGSLLAGSPTQGWHLHALVRPLAAAHLTEHRDAMEHRFSRALLAWAGGLRERVRADNDPNLTDELAARLPDLNVAWSHAVHKRDFAGLQAALPGLLEWTELREDIRNALAWFHQGRPLLEDPTTPQEVRSGLVILASHALPHEDNGEEAIQLLEDALTAANLESEWHIRLLIAQAKVLVHVGESAQAREACETAWQLASSEGSAEEQGAVLLTFAALRFVLMKGDLEHSVLPEAVECLEKTSNHALLRKARMRHFEWLRATSRLADAEPLGKAALEAARAMGDQSALARVQVNLGWVYRMMGQHEEALESFDAALEAARWGGADITYFATTKAEIMLVMGALDEADSVLLDLLDEDEVPGAASRSRLWATRGYIAMARRQPRDSMDCFEKAEAELEGLFEGNAVAMLTPRLNRAWGFWALGEFATATATLGEVLPSLAERSATVRYPNYALQALLLADQGHRTEAIEWALRSLTIVETLTEYMQVSAMIHFAGILHRLGNEQLAADLIPLLESQRYPERWIYLPMLQERLAGMEAKEPAANAAEAVARVRKALEDHQREY